MDCAHSSVNVFLGNLFFLQSIYFPSFGSDMPLWSLSYEFWYYLLFPILLLVLVPSSPAAKRLAYALAGLAIILMVGKDITLLFLVWLAGAGIGLVHDMRPQYSQRTSVWSTYCFAALGLVGLLVVRVSITAGLASDFLVAAFLPAMHVLVQVSGPGVNPAYAALAKLLSSFSYSLYVAHLPLLILIRTCLGGGAMGFRLEARCLRGCFGELCRGLFVWSLASHRSPNRRSPTCSTWSSQQGFIVILVIGLRYVGMPLQFHRFHAIYPSRAAA